MNKTRRCDYCSLEIGDQEQGYGLNIEMFALADPLEFNEEDLKKDYQEELEKLVKKMELLNVVEEEDKIHEMYRFILCPDCRADLHRRLKDRYFTN